MSQALILAAGRGERLRPATDQTPKPLLNDGDQPLIDRHLHALAAAGVRRVVVNLGWLGEQVMAHVGDGSRFGVTALMSPEGYPTLDTGGAIRRALSILDDAPFWVVNADIHCGFDFSQGPAAMLGQQDAAIGLVDNPPYRDDGDFSLTEGLCATQGPDRRTFSGIACYRPEFFTGLPDGRFSIVPLLRQAADEQRLAGFDIAEDWFDIGTPERLAALRDRLANVS